MCMATKKNESDVRKLAVSDSLILGAERTIKELKRGNLSKVLIASNCSKKIKATVQYYCEISKIPFEELKEDDVELGVLCKKQFSISVAGVIKNK